MGVDIASLFPIKEIKFEDLKNKVVGVDFFNVAYQFLSSIRGYDGTPLHDSKGKVTSHLQGLFSRSLNLMSKGIKLVYVIDGISPELKHMTKEERNSRKLEAEAKFHEAEDNENYDDMLKYSKQFIRLDSEMVKESCELLEAMGLPVIYAPSEAEGQIAFMCKNNDVYACASQDADSLMFGSPRLIRNMTLSQKRTVRGKTVYTFLEFIELKELLDKVNINHEQLIAIGIMCGSVDYNEYTLIMDENGLKLTKIGELFDDIVNKKQSENILIPCFDFKSKKISFRKVKKFIKHELKESLFEVKTTYGRKVKVTASHSLFTVKNEHIEPIKTTEIKKGDNILIPIKVSTPTFSNLELNIADILFDKIDNIKSNISIDGPSIREIVKSRVSKKKTIITDKRLILTENGAEIIKKTRKENNIAQSKCLFNESTISSWERRLNNPTKNIFSRHLEFLGLSSDNFINDNTCVAAVMPSIFEETMDKQMGSNLMYRKTLKLKSLTKDETKNLCSFDRIYSRREKGIKVKISLNLDFMKILGYYLAEGNSNNSYRLSFSFNYENLCHDDYCIKELKESIYNVFGINVKVYNEKSGRHLCIDNLIIQKLFINGLTLGSGSKNKRIPDIIYGMPDEFKIELLKAEFLGDGSLNEESISFNTSSEELANGISYILLQLGIVSSIFKKADGMFIL
ncbi:MAG: LAGLIDADG family homing endonuclease, partial [Nanoarchaeota archaeon]